MANDSFDSFNEISKNRKKIVVLLFQVENDKRRRSLAIFRKSGVKLYAYRV